ncbi:MAG TPA: PhzF family phenazine biosynthesis protein [Nocardioidaceae bacterium]|nr:PhzF family phenazine biosynthesis protein [Nocardioidaceae bacterium]
MTDYHHVDVFSNVPYAGNSVAVFVDPPELTTSQMLRITQELRHFETIFVTRSATSAVEARVFDLTQELDFAGHPVLGAAAVLHDLAEASTDEERLWTIALRAQTVRVTTRRETPGQVSALLDQGQPDWIDQTAAIDRPAVAAAFGLEESDLDDTLPLEIVSTGLRYLIVPVRGAALARASVTHADLAGFLDRMGAQYAYVLDPAAVEGRHWENDGSVEDIATGSAAGCVAAYLVRHVRAAVDTPIALAQGRFVGRPSTIIATVHGSPDAINRVTVAGDVSLVATGSLRALPPP